MAGTYAGQLDRQQGSEGLRPRRAGALSRLLLDPRAFTPACEDYRAGATLDPEHDEADQKAGKTIACPTLVLWGDAGIPAQGLSPLDIWRSARELRKHVNALARAPGETMARVMRARAGSLFSLFSGGLSNPVLLDAEILLEQFWPDAVPATFAKLRIPLVVAATDFHARREAALSDGPLLSAVAGSMAIPGLMKPVSRDGHVLIDGGVTNPLPFDHLFGKGGGGGADIVVALDVIGEPATAKDALPSSFEAMFGAAQIMQRALANRLIALKAPDLLFRPPVEAFRILDFFRTAQILEAGDALKDEIKRALAARLEAA
jgi:NTE family protein